jgi:hypothetical protein
MTTPQSSGKAPARRFNPVFLGAAAGFALSAVDRTLRPETSHLTLWGLAGAFLFAGLLQGYVAARRGKVAAPSDDHS